MKKKEPRFPKKLYVSMEAGGLLVGHKNTKELDLDDNASRAVGVYEFVEAQTVTKVVTHETKKGQEA